MYLIYLLGSDFMEMSQDSYISLQIVEIVERAILPMLVPLVDITDVGHQQQTLSINPPSRFDQILRAFVFEHRRKLATAFASQFN